MPDDILDIRIMYWGFLLGDNNLKLMKQVFSMSEKEWNQEVFPLALERGFFVFTNQDLIIPWHQVIEIRFGVEDEL